MIGGSTWYGQKSKFHLYTLELFLIFQERKILSRKKDSLTEFKRAFFKVSIYWPQTENDYNADLGGEKKNKKKTGSQKEKKVKVGTLKNIK